MSVNSTIRCTAGEDVTIPFRVSVDGTSAGAAVDITGWALRFQVWKRNDPTLAALIDKAPTLTTPASGLAEQDLTHDETLRDPGDYYWELWRTDTDSIKRLQAGMFTLLKEARYVPPSS